MKRRTQSKIWIQGFTLVEMSIVLVIMSIVLTGGLLASANFAQRQALIETEKRIEEVHSTLNRFHARNGHLPCPASLTFDYNHPDFGVATGVAVGTGVSAFTCDPGLPIGSLQAGTVRASGTNSQEVRIGTLPTRALGIPDDMMADAWGNRFIYAVSEEHTDASKFSAASGVGTNVNVLYPGGIEMLGANGVAATDVSFVVLSMGENGRKTGAYRYYTGAQVGTCAGTLESENCNLANGTFRETRFNDGDQPATYFDDFVRYSQHFLLGALGIGNISTECSNSNKGIVRYNTAANARKREYCDGNHWMDIPDSTSSEDIVAACYAFEKGMIRVEPSTVNSSGVLQECDGVLWKNVF